VEAEAAVAAAAGAAVAAAAGAAVTEGGDTEWFALCCALIACVMGVENAVTGADPDADVGTSDGEGGVPAGVDCGELEESPL